MGKKNGGKLHKIRVKGLRNVSLWVINLTNFCGGFSDTPPPTATLFARDKKNLKKGGGGDEMQNIYTWNYYHFCP